MREIKFRVWCKNRNEWEKDKCVLSQEGYLYQMKSLMPLRENTHIVQFCTGSKDKNGKEIYDGDIVNSGQTVGTIEFKNARFYINWCLNKDFWNDNLGINGAHCEIIGNIYENPEFLEAPNDL